MIRAERHIETEKEVCGEITVFLSLILTCICALMGGLFESARAAGSGWYMQMALNSSLDSLMSCYHREIWDKYRIFVLECADKERLAAEMEPQMETYLAAAPFYPVSGGKVQIEAMDAITGHNGDFFAKEVTDYMKVGVWTLESEESELPEMEKRMTEARAVHGIAEGYQENGRKVLRLEESIEAIGACLQKQEKHLEEMEAAVRQADGSSFFQSAESLEKELKQIPGLVAAYEKQADRLAKELQGSEQGAQEAQPDLEEGSWGMVQEEMRGYRSYLDADGARRQEVKKTEETAHGNEEVVAEAVRKGKEIQDYIDDWEPDDEDDELDEVVDFLADNINANVREIEGALSSLVANASFLGKKITVTLAKEILKVYVQFTQKEITIDHIQKVVCEYLGLPEEKFKSPRRTREIAQARQIAMYLSKQHTKAPLTIIGASIGGKNHATVLHACKAISNLMETDKVFRHQIEEIEKRVLAK